MDHPTPKSRRLIQGLLLAAVLVTAILGSVLAVRLPGCRFFQSPAVNYDVELLSLNNDGSWSANSSGSFFHARSGHVKTWNDAYLGKVTIKVQAVTSDSVTVDITYPDETTATLQIAPGQSAEHFHRNGLHGVRVKIDKILDVCE